MSTNAWYSHFWQQDSTMADAHDNKHAASPLWVLVIAAELADARNWYSRCAGDFAGVSDRICATWCQDGKFIGVTALNEEQHQVLGFEDVLDDLEATPSCDILVTHSAVTPQNGWRRRLEAMALNHAEYVLVTGRVVTGNSNDNLMPGWVAPHLLDLLDWKPAHFHRVGRLPAIFNWVSRSEWADLKVSMKINGHPGRGMMSYQDRFSPGIVSTKRFFAYHSGLSVECPEAQRGRLEDWVRETSSG